MDKNKKALVIGGSGFLGSHLAETLNDKGYKVTILDKQKIKLNRKIKFIKGHAVPLNPPARNLHGNPP